VIAQVVRALAGSARVQVGGGVRSIADAQALQQIGVGRVVMGSAAVAEPLLVNDVAQEIDVAVGLDHRNGVAATHGWTQSSGVLVDELLGQFPRASAFVITDISRDGMLTGPDLEGLARAISLTKIPVIASGGVGDLSHVQDLSTLTQLDGVIVGKAIYENRFTVAEAVQVLS
jgi:phosphoribosylformimino-5-aminoimidazole carboxamide ribotide isomerase